MTTNFTYYFLGPDANWGIGLASLYRNFFFLYHSPDPLATRLLKNRFFCTKHSQANSGKLLAHPQTQAFINTTKKGQVVIVPFKPSAKIAHICQANHWLYAAADPGVSRLFENKITFTQLLKHKPYALPSQLLPWNPTSFAKAAKEFGLPLVVQKGHGWAGNSSFLLTRFQATPILLDEIVRFAPFIQGTSLTLNAYIGKSGLAIGPPALQITGHKPWTNNPLATCGRQWPAMLSKVNKVQLQTIARDFSTLLTKHRFQGFFGLDFLLSNNQIYLLECNPRLTASFLLYTILETNKGLLPLFQYHLAEFTQTTMPNLQDRYFQTLKGAELVYRNAHSHLIGIPELYTNLRTPLTTTKSVSTYTLQCPPPGQNVSSGAEVFRITGRKVWHRQTVSLALNSYLQKVGLVVSQ